MNTKSWKGLAVLCACLTVAGCKDSASSGGSSAPTPTPYSLGGTVTGLSGSGLVLQDSAGDTLAISADGPFVFARQIVGGSDFYVSVVTQPTGPVQTCLVSGGSGVLTSATANSVSVTCGAKPSTSDSLGGVVTGLQGSGLVLQDSQGDTLAIAGDGPFVFPTRLTSGTAYTVSVLTPPATPYQDCSLSNATGTAGATDIAAVVVSCKTNSNPTEPVSVTVSGVSGTGVTVVLENEGRDAIQATSDGSYTFATTVPAGSPYSVTAQVSGGSISLTCAVSAGSGVVQMGVPAVVAIQCEQNAGVVITTSGLAGTGLLVQDNLGDPPFAIHSNGTASFPTSITRGQPYQLTVLAQPSGPTQTCVPLVTSGVAGSQPNALIAASFTCTTNTYTVSGVVTGLPAPLAGASLTLLDNGGDPLPPISANGPFTFPTSVASGAAYAVTVATQPGNSTAYTSGYTQTDIACVVSTSGVGVVGGGPVTGIIVQCVHQPLGFMYVSNAGDNTLSTYLVDGSGALVAFGAPVASGTSPASVVGLTLAPVVAPQPAAVLYAANSGSNSLSVYTADPQTGMPTAFGSALSLGLQRPSNLILDPSGSYLYAGNYGAGPGYVSELTLGTATAPAPLAASPSVAVGNAPIASVTVNPYVVTPGAPTVCSNRYYYFADATDNAVSLLVQNITTGALAPPTVPTATSFATGAAPSSIAAFESVDANFNSLDFVYVTNSGDPVPTISQFSVDCPTGALTAVGPPVSAGAGLKSAVTVGNAYYGPRYLYASTTAGLMAFSIGPTGVLSAAALPSPIAAGTAPGSLTAASQGFFETGATAVGSNQVTLAAADPAVVAGMTITGAGIPSGTVITAVNGVTLTLSAPATAAYATDSLNVFETYVYVTNTGDNTVSAFRVDFGSGQLLSLGPAVKCGASPSALFFMRRPNFAPLG